MNPERWRQVDQLFQSALEHAPEDRSAFISEACGGDVSLRREVEALLAADGQGKSFIEHPAYAMGAPLIVVDDMRSLLGKSIGHYQITSLLGKGGMGEVYHARDPRLGREVAIKVLPREYSADADRLRRFEQEARAAGMLNHPNILTIYDVGAHDGAPYLVSELLEGATLREQLRGAAAPLTRALDYAVQMARGLAAAHEKGIVHRDLKPENLFITKDGRLKILDFGLAKLRQPLPGGVVDTGAPPLPQRTAPGVLIGTVGYMSPEQVRAEELDQRSDIFACGAILYEMLAGQRAFRGASAAETMNAILKEEPPALSQTNPNVAPALERVMRRCLEKNVEERFQSALDLAFALEALSGASAPSAVAQVMAPGRPGRRLWPWSVIALLIVALAARAIFFVGKQAEKTSPEFQRLSFRRGMIGAARFAPDNQTVIYSAKWQGEPHQLYSTRPESPESRPFGQLDADILAISVSGELAIALHPSYDGTVRLKGTLAQMSLTAIAPRQLLQDVIAADWASDGKRLAIVREVNGRNRLEFPIGTVLYETPRGISKLRISPTGEWIAFDEGATVNVVDLAGKKETLSSGWQIIVGLAWSPGGDEVWFAAPKTGFNAALYAVTLSGQQRLVARIPHSMRLFDISRDGRVLLGATNISKGIKYLSQGETQERDLSWLDWGHVAERESFRKTPSRFRDFFQVEWLG